MQAHFEATWSGSRSEPGLAVQVKLPEPCWRIGCPQRSSLANEELPRQPACPEGATRLSGGTLECGQHLT